MNRWVFVGALLLASAAGLAAEGGGGRGARVVAWAPGATETLTAGDLKAWVGDEPTPVASVQGPGDPLILIVVMDLVGDLNRVDRARDTLATRIQEMEPYWHVALLHAQDGVRVVEDPTRDRGGVVEKLLALPVTGFPGLMDAVDPVAEIADRTLNSAPVRVAVLFLTDGSISQYRGDYTAPVVNPSDSRDLSRSFGGSIIQEKFASLTDSVAARAAPLFFVHLEERQNGQDVSYQTGIRQLAQATGGDAVFVRGLADVGGSVNMMLDRIRDSYAVTMEVPDGLNGSARIRLETAGGESLTHREALTFVKGSKKGKKR